MGKRRILLFSIVVSVLFLVVGCIPSETNTNKPPSWKSIPDQNIKVGESVSINLLNYASDPDGDQLTFEIITGEGIISGSTYTYRGESEGRETVTIRVKDTKGAYADTSFVINVSSGNQSVSLKWKYKTDGKIYSSPAICSDGTIYMGSADSYLYAINPDGSLKWWYYETGGSILSSPAIGSDGTIYVGSVDSYLYAINPDGSLKWKYKTDYYIYSSPAIGSDAIYVGSGIYLYAINPDGLLDWEYKTDYLISSSPAIGSDGTIYVGSVDSYLYAINPDGSLKWKYKTDGEIDSSSPAIDSDGTIYVGSRDSYLYAINPDGSLKWRYETDYGILSSPAIGSDGTIYVGSYDYYLYAINPDGSLKWKYKTNDDIFSSPAIGSDGTIYVGSYDNHLYAIQGESEGLADTPWPKFRKNNRNTGNYDDAE